MKILFLTNNDISSALQTWLRDTAGEEVTECRQRLSLDLVDHLRPQFTISYNYRFILPAEIIQRLDHNIINLHTSFLPWNRGSSPNLWSFLKETPKGVTIHQLDSGIDTGDIFAQKKLEFDESTETLESTYKTLHAEIQRLFQEIWPAVADKTLLAKPQTGAGSGQSNRDFRQIESILEPDGWKTPIAVLKKRYASHLRLNTNGPKKTEMPPMDSQQ